MSYEIPEGIKKSIGDIPDNQFIQDEPREQIAINDQPLVEKVHQPFITFDRYLAFTSTVTAISVGSFVFKIFYDLAPDFDKSLASIMMKIVVPGTLGVAAGAVGAGFGFGGGLLVAMVAEEIKDRWMAMTPYFNRINF